MAKRRRKTLVVCATCHDAIHADNLTATLTAVVTGEPDAGKASTAGSEGGRGKRTGTAGTSPDGLPCPGNRRSCPGVGSGAPGDPRDMAKAGLPEAQSPEVQSHTL